MSTATLPVPTAAALSPTLLEQLDDAVKDHDLNDAPTEAAILLEYVSQFIGRYLECSEQQRTVMALWVFHTYCLPSTRLTPYLSIQSTEKQSGKTLCLQLLSMLIKDPALTAGFTAAALTRRIDTASPAFLLDECQATIGTRVRPKSPVLRAILASGCERGSGYTDATHERNIFGPKAFAGNGPLPEELADRSIPIILKPLSDPLETERLGLETAGHEAEPLRELLSQFSGQHQADLADERVYDREQLPPNFSPRRQDMIEPLLQLAGYAGGPWPQRIREALDVIFQEGADFELQESLQLLADLRDCFAHLGYPERLSTADLLAWLHTQPARSWDVDGAITARRLARLLSPFEIVPRVQRIGTTSRLRGYQLQDFIEHWQTHLGFDPALVTHVDDEEITNNDAACHAVTDSPALSETSTDESQSEPNGSEVGFGVRLSQQPKAKSQRPVQLVAGALVTPVDDAEIVNNDAVCCKPAVVGHAVTAFHRASDDRTSIPRFSSAASVARF